MAKPTLLIADDHPIMLKGLVSLLQDAGYRILAGCTSGVEVEAALSESSPDILVLDVNMPPPNGFALLRQIKESNVAGRVVLLTSSIEDVDVLRAVRLGVDGIVLKESASRQLLLCLDSVTAGERWLDPELTERALNAALVGQQTARPQLSLTSRELQVVELVSRGMRNKEVARTMQVTEGTVKVYLHAIYEKLGVTSRVELANAAREHGLV